MSAQQQMTAAANNRTLARTFCCVSILQTSDLGRMERIGAEAQLLNGDAPGQRDASAAAAAAAARRRI
jgi:hypothetical protein